MTPSATFGTLLRQLRKRAGMTQGDLAAAVGYSVSFVSDLEQNRGLPAVAAVLQQFIPALGLQAEAGFATHLVELAALARGERSPATITVQRSAQLTITETFTFSVSRLPAQPQGNRYGITDCLGTLGRIALLRGDLAQAQRLFHEVMTLAAVFSYHLMRCMWQPLLGIATLYSDDAAEARRLLTESLHFCLELKNEFCLAQVYSYLAQVALWEGVLEQAEQWLAQSLTYYTTPRRITIDQVERLFVAARLATARQKYPRAATLFGLAEQMHSQVHYAIAGPMRALADAGLAIVRAALDQAIFAEAFSIGQQMSLEEAFATILVPVDGQN